LPKALEKTNKKGSPTVASYVYAILQLVILAAFLLSGADAWSVVFFWFSALGTVGFITILLVTSLAIFVFFVKTKSPGNPLVIYVAPILSVIAFIYVGYLTWENFDVLSGGNPVARYLVLLMPVLFIVGLIIGFTRPKKISFENANV